MVTVRIEPVTNPQWVAWLRSPTLPALGIDVRLVSGDTWEVSCEESALHELSASVDSLPTPGRCIMRRMLYHAGMLFDKDVARVFDRDSRRVYA